MGNGKWEMDMCHEQLKTHVMSTQYVSLGQRFVSRTVTGPVLTIHEVS